MRSLSMGLLLGFQLRGNRAPGGWQAVAADEPNIGMAARARKKRTHQIDWYFSTCLMDGARAACPRRAYFLARLRGGFS